jgi:hypothetical protein
MRQALLRTSLSLLVVAGGLLGSIALHAQEITVRGRVIGPDNAPLADQRVVLHRVDASGGATIAETRSAEDGFFTLSATAEPDTSAVLFVAARYDDELYIGPPFRAGDMTAMDQQIQVGVPSMSATAMLEGGDALPMPRRRPPQGLPTWLLVVIPLLGVVGVAAWALLPRSHVPAERALLIRVAELDERMDSATDAQRAAMRDERRRLIAQLREG